MVIDELEHLDDGALLHELDHPTPLVDWLGPDYLDEVACALRRRDPTAAAEALAKGLANADVSRSTAILLALSLFGHDDARQAPVFAAALSDQRPEVAAAAIDALNAVGDTTQSVTIGTRARDPDPLVRAAVLRYVAGQRHPEAVRLLREGLRDRDLHVRANAVESLGELVGRAPSRG